jgi:hypothetical protein
VAKEYRASIDFFHPTPPFFALALLHNHCVTLSLSSHHQSPPITLLLIVVLCVCDGVGVALLRIVDSIIMATNFMRAKVSKRKRRYIDKKDGFDLDLSYILDYHTQPSIHLTHRVRDCTQRHYYHNNENHLDRLTALDVQSEQ